MSTHASEPPTLAELAARPNGAAMEGKLRNVGALMDEINDVAGRLGGLFRRLDEAETGLKEGMRNGDQPTLLTGGTPKWVDEARKSWREHASVARSEHRRDREALEH